MVSHRAFHEACAQATISDQRLYISSQPTRSRTRIAPPPTESLIPGLSITGAVRVLIRYPNRCVQSHYLNDRKWYLAFPVHGLKDQAERAPHYFSVDYEQLILLSPASIYRGQTSPRLPPIPYNRPTTATEPRHSFTSNSSTWKRACCSEPAK